MIFGRKIYPYLGRYIIQSYYIIQPSPFIGRVTAVAPGQSQETSLYVIRLFWSLMSAADNAAVFAIAERITDQVRRLNMAIKSANDGLSMLALI